MCDTLCVVADGRLLFAKNSDRPVGEVQLVEQWPRRPATTAPLRAQYIDLGADPGAVANASSRPAWLWGFEHGVNTHGVAIGNEKIWTTDDPSARADALLGMDLVRLGLERATTADGALHLITTLLEQYGQGGSGEEHQHEPYDNAFLIADTQCAWILETNDRQWAARRVEGGGAAISNRVSLTDNWDLASPGINPGFDVQAWRSPTVPTGRADRRLAATTACVSTADPARLHAGDVVATLRDHGAGPWGDPRAGTTAASRPPTPPPIENRDDGYGFTVCMHLRDSKATTASMVCELHADDRVSPRAWFALGSPCVSVYVPVFLPSIPAALGNVNVWHAFDRLRVRVEADGDQLATIRSVLGPVEADLWARADEQWASGVIDPSWHEHVWDPIAEALTQLGA